MQAGMSFRNLLHACKIIQSHVVLLPELHHCTGEVGGVCDGVVCVTFICVPGIVTRAPWKVLKNRVDVFVCPPSQTSGLFQSHMQAR